MWYQTIPDVSAVSFLGGVVRLFGAVLRAVISAPALSVFLGLAALMVAVALFQLLFHSVKTRW